MSKLYVLSAAACVMTLNAFASGSLFYWQKGTEAGSEFYWNNGWEVGSQYYWENALESGSRYYWNMGQGLGSAFYWKYGMYAGSEYFWKHGIGAGFAEVPLIAICLGLTENSERETFIPAECDDLLKTGRSL